MKPPIRLIAFLFFVAAALLVGSMVLTYRVGLLAIQSERKMVGQLSVLKQLDDLMSTLRGAETGERGFLLTGEEAYLEPYQKAQTELNAQLDGLRRMIATGDLPKAKVDQLIELVGQKLAELNQTIRTRREQGLDAALTIVRSDRGREIMEEIYREISDLRAAEQKEFNDASQFTEKSVMLRTLTFASIGSINLAFLLWAFRRVSREVSRREAAVSETNQQKELLATTLASIGDAVIVTDSNHRITFLNAEAERLTGWENSEATGQPLTNIFRIINEHTRQPAENPADRALSFHAVVTLAADTLLIRKDGKEIPIDDSAAPIRQSDGPVFGVVIVFRDFTEQKKTQQLLAQSKQDLERLVEERTAKLREMVSELEHVSYAITHDMRAPLRAMSAFSTFLLEEAEQHGGSDEMKDYSRRIQVAANRLDKLILDALHYTKAVLQEMPMEPVELEKLVHGLVETYPNLQPDKADIRFESELPAVIGNESLLTQCFSNLLGNAVKFVPTGVRPEIRVRAENNGHVSKIWIRDNGIGIPPHSRDRLFKMFQRLTSEYEGSGIGLAIVRKVIERMGGKVGVESEPGIGSSFWVELKLAGSEEK
jgi:PAS domain S-box-containing protein